MSNTFSDEPSGFLPTEPSTKSNEMVPSGASRRKPRVKKGDIGEVRAAVKRKQLLSQLREAERQDLVVLDNIRLHLAENIRKDVDWWYAQAKRLAETALREQDSQVRMVQTIFNKILADRREKDVMEDRARGSNAVMIFNVQGEVKRGTKEAVDALRRVNER